MCMPLAVRAVKLRKVYSDGTVGNEEINLEVSEGEFFSLLGPNGAGKTTFIRMVSTELLPTSGELVVLGYDAVKEPMPIRRRIGVVPQGGLPVFNLTVFDHVYYFARLKGLPKAEARSKALKALDELDLKEYRDRLVGSLSGGLMKRVLIATAIAHEPELLLLDEPTTGLDPAVRRKLWNYLTQLKKRGTTIIMTTHYVEEAENLSDRVAIINRGRVVMCDTVESLIMRSRYPYRVVLRGRRGLDDLVPEVQRLGVYYETGSNNIVIWMEDLDEEALVKLVRLAKAKRVDIFLSSTSLEDVYLEVVGGHDGAA